MRHYHTLALLLLLSGCSSSSADDPPGNTIVDNDIVAPVLSNVQPFTIVPGTLIKLSGSAFTDPSRALTSLRLVGSLDNSPVDLLLPTKLTQDNELLVSWPGASAGLPADSGSFIGDAILEVPLPNTTVVLSSAPLPVKLSFQKSLQPKIKSVQTGMVFPNDVLTIEGEGFLLGGQEGFSTVVLQGCYKAKGASSCKNVGPVNIRGLAAPYDRSRLTFPFSPAIQGIVPGTLDGTLKIVNLSTTNGSVTTESPVAKVNYDQLAPTLFSASPNEASLGQFVNFDGAGFVGTKRASVSNLSLTSIILKGTYTPSDSPKSIDVNVSLITDYKSGHSCQYVMNEEDQLGQNLDLRNAKGSFNGTMQVVTKYSGDTVNGDTKPLAFNIAPVRQIVWLRYLASYVESLRHFGLRSADALIRDRVLAVATRDFQGINVEFRTTQPADFALYSQVEISGPDPNGSGLLGYDNTPGKDVDNQRLYDKIGGVNASTQEDGYPGYGGVFLESFLGFSQHPGDFAKKLEAADPVFDKLFDPFRPDQGGLPVSAQDLAAGIPVLTNADSCPASNDRPLQIACAIWGLGSMIGTTMTHELGHSLGLADPYGNAFHNPGDEKNRLMDGGSARSLLERIEMLGEGPAVFCQDDYDYLRKILASKTTPPNISRPVCF